MLKAVIFDLDETLLDWSGRTQPWETHEWEHLGYVFEHVTQQIHPLPSREAFYDAVLDYVSTLWGEAKKTLVAPHIGEVLVTVLADQGVPRQLLNQEECLRAYRFALIEGVKAYPEVYAVLEQLQTYGIKMGLATNSMHPMSLRDTELEATALLPFFEQPYRLSAADVGYLKPHARIFEELLHRMKLTPKEAAFVGDSLHADIGGAQQVGMKAILRKQAQPSLPKNGNGHIQPDAAIENLTELLPTLDALYPQWRA